MENNPNVNGFRAIDGLLEALKKATGNDSLTIEDESVASVFSTFQDDLYNGTLTKEEFVSLFDEFQTSDTKQLENYYDSLANIYDETPDGSAILSASDMMLYQMAGEILWEVENSLDMEDVLNEENIEKITTAIQECMKDDSNGDITLGALTSVLYNTLDLEGVDKESLRGIINTYASSRNLDIRDNVVIMAGDALKNAADGMANDEKADYSNFETKDFYNLAMTLSNTKDFASIDFEQLTPEQLFTIMYYYNSDTEDFSQYYGHMYTEELQNKSFMEDYVEYLKNKGLEQQDIDEEITKITDELFKELERDSHSRAGMVLFGEANILVQKYNNTTMLNQILSKAKDDETVKELLKFYEYDVINTLDNSDVDVQEKTDLAGNIVDITGTNPIKRYTDKELFDMTTTLAKTKDFSQIDFDTISGRDLGYMMANYSNTATSYEESTGNDYAGTIGEKCFTTEYIDYMKSKGMSDDEINQELTKLMTKLIDSTKEDKYSMASMALTLEASQIIADCQNTTMLELLIEAAKTNDNIKDNLAQANYSVSEYIQNSALDEAKKIQLKTALDEAAPEISYTTAGTNTIGEFIQNAGADVGQIDMPSTGAIVTNFNTGSTTVDSILRLNAAAGFQPTDNKNIIVSPKGDRLVYSSAQGSYRTTPDLSEGSAYGIYYEDMGKFTGKPLGYYLKTENGDIKYFSFGKDFQGRIPDTFKQAGYQETTAQDAVNKGYTFDWDNNYIKDSQGNVVGQMYKYSDGYTGFYLTSSAMNVSTGGTAGSGSAAGSGGTAGASDPAVPDVAAADTGGVNNNQGGNNAKATVNWPDEYYVEGVVTGIDLIAQQGNIQDIRNLLNYIGSNQIGYNEIYGYFRDNNMPTNNCQEVAKNLVKLVEMAKQAGDTDTMYKLVSTFNIMYVVQKSLETSVETDYTKRLFNAMYDSSTVNKSEVDAAEPPSWRLFDKGVLRIMTLLFDGRVSQKDARNQILKLYDCDMNKVVDAFRDTLFNDVEEKYGAALLDLMAGRDVSGYGTKIQKS